MREQSQVTPARKHILPTIQKEEKIQMIERMGRKKKKTEKHSAVILFTALSCKNLFFLSEILPLILIRGIFPLSFLRQER